MRYPGELASLATAVCWTASALSFSAAGRRIGSLPVNIIRLFLAALLLSAIIWFRLGLLFPAGLGGRAWLLLGASGLVGFFIGDLCLFRSYLLIGPRRAMLMMCLWPVVAALLSWLAWGQTITGMKLAGMTVTLAGIAWVISERGDSDDANEGEAAMPTCGEREAARLITRPKVSAKTWGVCLAALGAAGQATGYVLAQPVLGKGGCDPFVATLIRSLAGLTGFIVLFTMTGQWPRVWAARRDPRALALTANGALWGPCLGVSLSLLALKYVAVGVAATLASTSPVVMIPAVILLHHERVSWRSALGACVAVAGVALLFV